MTDAPTLDRVSSLFGEITGDNVALPETEEVDMQKTASIFVHARATPEHFMSTVDRSISSTDSNEYLVQMAFHEELEKIGFVGKAMNWAGKGLSNMGANSWGGRLQVGAGRRFQAGAVDMAKRTASAPAGSLQKRHLQGRLQAANEQAAGAYRGGQSSYQEGIKKKMVGGTESGAVEADGLRAKAREAKDLATSTGVKSPRSKRIIKDRKAKKNKAQPVTGQPAPANHSLPVHGDPNAGFLQRNFGWGQAGAVPTGPLQQNQSRTGNWYRGLSRDQVHQGSSPCAVLLDGDGEDRHLPIYSSGGKRCSS